MDQTLDVTGRDQVYYRSQGDEIRVKQEIPEAGAGKTDC